MMLYITDMASVEALDGTDTSIVVLGSYTKAEHADLFRKLSVYSNYKRMSFHGSFAGMKLMQAFCFLLGNLSQLTQLAITNAPDLGIEAVGQLLHAVSRSMIRNLDLSGLELGTEGARLLCKAVNESGRINTLRVERNNLQRAVGAVLALDLRSIHIGDNNVHRLWWPDFFQNAGSSVSRLSVTESNISHAGFTSLSEYVLNSTMLMDLNVSGNVLQLDSLKKLCAGLIGHKTLTVLRLMGCGLKNKSTVPICSMLGLNQSLEQLYMHNNPKVTVFGQLMLVKGLQANYTLKYIEIDVLFASDCNYLETSRVSIDKKETMTGHLCRLVCFNQDLDLKEQFWQPKIHHYYPDHVKARVDAVVNVLTGRLPHELILHILSFWKGVV